MSADVPSQADGLAAAAEAAAGEIARLHLGLESLQAQNSDSADFIEISIWSLHAALVAAFNAGVCAALNHKTEG